MSTLTQQLQALNGQEIIVRSQVRKSFYLDGNLVNIGAQFSKCEDFDLAAVKWTRLVLHVVRATNDGCIVIFESRERRGFYLDTSDGDVSDAIIGGKSSVFLRWNKFDRVPIDGTWAHYGVHGKDLSDVTINLQKKDWTDYWFDFAGVGRRHYIDDSGPNTLEIPIAENSALLKASKHDSRTNGPTGSYGRFSILPHAVVSEMNRGLLSVYWCARDLGGGAPIGNHHFLLFAGGAELITKKFKTVFRDHAPCEKNGVYFYTVAGSAENGFSPIKGYGKMVMHINDQGDSDCFEELKDGPHMLKPDDDLEMHNVTELERFKDLDILKRFLSNYNANEHGESALQYKIQGPNCSSWANTLLKALGVPDDRRKHYRDFAGADVGEDKEFSTDYFTKIIQ